MIFRILLPWLLFTASICPPLNGQEIFRLIPEGTTRFVIPVELSQNLIILPAGINGSSPMKLVLDSGINNTIITGLNEQDTLTLENARSIRVGGLGYGTPVEAFHSKGNRIKISFSEDTLHYLVGQDIELFVLTTDQFELSRQLGMKVNGLIGAELFESFVVRMDPVLREITFYDRKTFNYKSRTRGFERIPLRISNGRAFMDVKIIQEDNSELIVKLLVDTGASLAFWIAPVSDPAIRIPARTVRSLLGQGLSGSISGVNGRLKKVQIGSFSFRKPLVSYPDSASISGLTLNQTRHGSIGNDIFRRFESYFDFADSCLYLRPNKNFRTPFTYNRSGMDVEKPDPNLPVFSIFSVIPGSPAYEAGLRAGDILEYVNYLPAFSLSLDEINNILYGESGNLVLVRINRGGEKFRAKFRLENKI